MEIGFTSTTFRQIKKPEKIVATAVRANADCIEWGGDVHVRTVADAARVRGLCREAGLSVSSYGSYYVVGSRKADEQRRVCEIAHETGADTLRVWLGSKNSEKTSADEYKIILEDTVSLCEKAKTAGLIVAPECHNGTYNNETAAFLKISADATASGVTNFGTYFQSKYRAFDYDCDRIERTLNETRIVHISFSEQTREQFFYRKDSRYCEKLIDKLLKCGYDRRFMLEYTYFASPEYFIRDMRRLRAAVENRSGIK